MTGEQLRETYRPISDYGLIGDTHSCALVSREGSVDWACFPRFDSRAVFARLLDSEKGDISPSDPVGSSKAAAVICRRPTSLRPRLERRQAS